MWEINFISTLDHGRSGSLLEAPNIDMNYGLGDHIQIKFEAPWLVSTGEGHTLTGFGNPIFGIKWRFLDEEKSGVDVSTYPQLEFNSSPHSVTLGLVDRGNRLFLPVEVKRSIAGLELDGEFGYRVVQYHANELEYGVVVGRQATKRIELIGELHGLKVRGLPADMLFYNLGSRVRLTRAVALLVSAGRTLRDGPGAGPRCLAAVGFEFSFSTGLMPRPNARADAVSTEQQR